MELEKENARQKDMLEKLSGPDWVSEADPKDPDFKESLAVLEGKRQACEKYGLHDELAKTNADIKALTASREATVPVGQQLKRAEQELAKRQKHSLAVEASLAEAKQRVEELEKKMLEAGEKKAEVEQELEKVKARVAMPLPRAKPENFSWADISAGHLDFFKVQSPDVLEKHGLGISEQQQLQDLLSRAAKVHEAATQERQRLEAATARQLAEAEAGKTAAIAVDIVDAAVGHARTSGQQPALAHAEAAKPAIVDDDVLMGLCEGSDAELAQAAKLIMESEVVTKRRKLANS